MSKFFDSEIVRQSMKELDVLQNKILSQMFFLPSFTKEEKRNHLKLLKDFLEKQKIFVFRISLSDDDDAVEMMQSIMNSAKLLGYDEINSIEKFFESMDETIENLEKIIDN